MRAYTPDERWALAFFAGPTVSFYFSTPDGARIDAVMYDLIERGCVCWRRMDDNSGATFWLTERGHIAARLSRLPIVC